MKKPYTSDKELGVGLKSRQFDDRLSIAPEFKKFVTTQILPLLPFDGYKLETKQRIAVQCIHNLSLVGLRKPPLVIRDARDNSTNRLRTLVWDVLREAGLCRIRVEGHRAIPGRADGAVTRYQATRKLLNLLAQHEQRKFLDLRLDFNSKRKRPTTEAHVTVHTGRIDLETGEKLPVEKQKKPLPWSALHPASARYLAEQERWNAVYNAIMAQHQWTIIPPDGTPYEPNYCLKWTHSGRPFRYMRLSGWSAISLGLLTKEERRHLVIDGEPAIELDYGSFDIRRHYHYAGIDVQGDAYRPEIIFPEFYASEDSRSRKAKEIVRKLVKKSTNICLNCGTKAQAHRTIVEELRKWSQRPRKFLWGYERESDFLWRVLLDIEQLEQPYSISLVKRIFKAHRDIRHVFLNSEYGSMMMSLGADMMHSIRKAFANENKPCYCIHDAVVCRRSDQEFARQTMIDVYHAWLRSDFDPTIKVEF